LEKESIDCKEEELLLPREEDPRELCDGMPGGVIDWYELEVKMPR